MHIRKHGRRPHQHTALPVQLIIPAATACVGLVRQEAEAVARLVEPIPALLNVVVQQRICVGLPPLEPDIFVVIR